MLLLRIARCVLLAAVLVLFASLSPCRARAALDAGRPACDYCRMIFTDPRFGAEITTRSGQLKIYDAIECMAAAVLTDSVPQRDIRGVFVRDHDAPHARIALSRAVFLHCPKLESPMGQSLLAFGSRARARQACRSLEGRVLDWRGVLTQVDSVWFQGRLAVESHMGPITRARRPVKRASR